MNSRCPACGLLEFEEARLVGEKPCSSLRCSAWKVIGKSKNGGPLLRIAQFEPPFNESGMEP